MPNHSRSTAIQVSRNRFFGGLVPIWTAISAGFAFGLVIELGNLLRNTEGGVLNDLLLGVSPSHLDSQKADPVQPKTLQNSREHASIREFGYDQPKRGTTNESDCLHTIRITGCSSAQRSRETRSQGR